MYPWRSIAYATVRRPPLTVTLLPILLGVFVSKVACIKEYLLTDLGLRPHAPDPESPPPPRPGLQMTSPLSIRDTKFTCPLLRPMCQTAFLSRTPNWGGPRSSKVQLSLHGTTDAQVFVSEVHYVFSHFMNFFCGR